MEIVENFEIIPGKFNLDRIGTLGMSFLKNQAR
jgi:hypothetical protein